MKAMSLTYGGSMMDRDLDGRIEQAGFWVRYTSKGILLDVHWDHVLSLAGGTLVRFDEGRSAGGAVAGAIVGGVLTGGLGALAGAALGGRKKHSLSLRHDSALLVFEATTAELQKIMGHGVQFDQKHAGSPVVTQKRSKSLTFLAVVLLAVGGIFLLGLLVRK